jgi:hypothetical protein
LFAALKRYPTNESMVGGPQAAATA